MAADPLRRVLRRSFLPSHKRALAADRNFSMAGDRGDGFVFGARLAAPGFARLANHTIDIRRSNVHGIGRVITRTGAIRSWRFGDLRRDPNFFAAPAFAVARRDRMDLGRASLQLANVYG